MQSKLEMKTAEIERKRLKKTGFENPVDVLTREDLWGEENERKTVLNLDLPEFHKWWEACKQLTPSVIGDYFMFTLLTGSRSVEAATLEWKTVDLDAGKMTFEDTKNRKDYTFPIAPETRKILERRLKEKINTYVFGYAESATGHVVCPPQHAIKQVRDESGVYWCMHDLRRTFATSLVELGVHPFAVMKLMKHREPSVTFGYVQPTHEQFLAIFTNYENHVLTKAKRQ